MAINFQFPTFSEDMLDTEKGKKQLFEALYQLTRQLKWVLSNLGEENFSEEYKEQSDTTALNEKINGNTASIRSLNGKVNNTVVRSSIIKAINDSQEDDGIAGGKLEIKDYTGDGAVRFLGLDAKGHLIEFSCEIYDSTTSTASEEYSITAVAPK